MMLKRLFRKSQPRHRAEQWRPFSFVPFNVEA